MTVHDMVTMLTAWSTGDDFVLHQWCLKAPAGLQNLLWQMDVVATPDFQFIEDLPPFDSRYRIARVSGGGDSFSQEVQARLLDAIHSMRPSSPHPVLWARDYLAVDWQVRNTLLAIELPIAVGIEASYDATVAQLNIAVHHRPPLTPADFEVRVGSGNWDASLPYHTLEPRGFDSFGWDVAGCLLPQAPGGSIKVWVHWIASQNDFDWELTIDLGRADSRDLRRERFLSDWYRLAHADLGADVRPRSARQQKGERSSEALEVAISNVCGALGMSVIFGGRVLESPGVDLLAFDSAQGVAYAISATVDNQIGEKLRQWLRIAGLVRSTLEPLWTVRPVIITSDPDGALPPSEVQQAAQSGVGVLSGSDLQGLQESPPDIQAFAQALLR